MHLAETSEEEEQAIDRLLGELGICLPAVEMNLDSEDLSGSVPPQDPDQSMQLDELREWRLVPSS
jgi:hypothetical protein